MAAATAVPAQAYITGTYSNGTNIRTCASTSCAAIGEGFNGQTAYIYCFVSGQNINGNPFWDKNTDHSTGVGPGYSADYYMIWSGTLNHC